MGVLITPAVLKTRATKGVRTPPPPSRRRRSSPFRSLAVRLHRWAGLGTAGFLVLTGVTGSVLAFHHELEMALNPHLFTADSVDEDFDPFELREKAERLVPDATIDQVVLRAEPGRSVIYWLTPRIDPATGEPAELAANQLFINPADGEQLGQRRWGELITDGTIKRENLVPFLLRLHYSLALPGSWGKWLLGAIAVIWTLDSLFGFYLTLPRLRRTRKPFIARWKPAWLVKWRAGAPRVKLDLHRATGLWLWIVLLIFAWSSVMLNLRQEVYKPIMSLWFEFTEPGFRAVSKPSREPLLDWRGAHAAAKREMERLANEEGFRVFYEDSLWLDRGRNVYMYRVYTNRDVYSAAHGIGKSRVFIDADTGAYLGAFFPSGEAAGDTVSSWLQALHMARIFGLPYQLFACLIGIAVAVLSITGLMIWAGKRRQ